MEHAPAYYRARLDAIEKAIRQADDDKQLSLLRNGYMPDLSIHDYSQFDNHPLSFLELTRWDTWFAMHPEKIAGETVISSSRSFPLKVKGTKEDITNAIMQQEDETSLIKKAEQELMNLIF